MGRHATKRYQMDSKILSFGFRAHGSIRRFSCGFIQAQMFKEIEWVKPMVPRIGAGKVCLERRPLRGSMGHFLIVLCQDGDAHQVMTLEFPFLVFGDMSDLRPEFLGGA